MKKENVFMTAKGHYETTFNDLERFYGESEKMLKGYIDKLESENSGLERNCDEWLEHAKKGLADYKDLVLKGLDYLSCRLEKYGENPLACAS